MLEFMFFNESLCRRFTQFAGELGLAASVAEDRIAGWVVAVPEQMPDEVLTAVEDRYEELMQEQERIAEAEEGWVERHVAGIEVGLADGRRRLVRLEAALATRLLEHFTPRELQALVEAVAQALDEEGSGPLCCSTDSP